MFKHTQRSTLYLVVIVVLILAGPLATEGRANFILWNDEQLMVTGPHSLGLLWDTSRATLMSGNFSYSSGNVSSLYAYNSSTVAVSGGGYDMAYVGSLYARDRSAVNISGGSMGYLYTYDSSTVNSGGRVGSLYARDRSAVNISGGSVTNLYTYGASTVDISGYGGAIGSLNANDFSTVTFHAHDFRLGAGLSLQDQQVLGTGWLSGEDLGGARWAVNITTNAAGANIWAVPAPEPMTMMLLGLGGLVVIGRRRR